MGDQDKGNRDLTASFSSLFQILPFAMVLLDSNGHLLHVNSSYSRLTGYGPADCLEKTLAEFCAGESSASCSAMLSEVRDNRAEKSGQTLDFVVKGQGIRSYDVTIFPINRNPRTRFIALFEAPEASDSQKLEALKERAEAALKTKSEFLAMMSHEIRTPIHSIVGLTELLSDTKLDEEQKEFLERIQFSADSLLSIVNDILDFSKIEAGKITQEILDFELHSAIENAVDMLTIEAHKKGLDVQLYIDAKVPKNVRGDSDHLRQVMVNLLSNAIKFTQRGEILVSVGLVAKKAESYIIKFWVKDSGIGMRPDQVEKIFQAFTQADASTSRKFGGTGLGLAISRGLVELMGGEIGVKSKPGVGSVFFFTTSFGKKPGQIDEQEIPAGLFTDQHILLVSSNKTLKMIVAHYLTGFAGVIEEAEGGHAALQKLKENAEGKRGANVCLIDLRLSDMDGWQLASEINADKEINMTRLVLLSPKDMGSGEARMKKLGWFNSYIGTPVKRKELIAALLSATNTDMDLAPADDGESAADADSDGLDKIDMSRVAVLVVEDNEINSQLFKIILENMGIKVTLAKDGIDAVKYARMLPYDIVFMDVQMPNMNGNEATKKIRELGITIPIIAVTANALKSEVREAMESGMDDYVTKPFKKQDIELILKKWLLHAARSNEQITEIEPDERNSQVFDYVKALDSFMGKRDMLSDIIEKFIAKVSGQIEAIENAIENNNITQVKAETHSIKGAAWNLTAIRLGDAALRLETAATSGQISSIAESLADLKHELGEFVRAVKGIS